MKRAIPFFWVIGSLLIAALACAQAGEIITPEEATRRADEEQNSRIFSAGNGDTFDGALQTGDSGELVGSSKLINLFDAPGGRLITGPDRGTIVTVQDVADDGERLWYRIDTQGYEGWVTEANIEKVASEPAPGEGASGPGPGDTATLAGSNFLIDLLLEPNGAIAAVEQRGANVTILEVYELDGETWYRVDTPGGEGWVTEEHLEIVEDESATGGSDEEAAPDPGDNVFLAGTFFLVDLLLEPNGNIAAVEQRGAEVTILETYELDGETWYRVDAAGGEGWVLEANISTEVPD